MIRAILSLSLGLAVALPAVADDAWYGIVKRKPNGDYQQWLVGSKQLSIAEGTAISTDVGPFDIGACAEVDSVDGGVGKLGTRSMSHCDQTDYDDYLAQFKAIAERAENADVTGKTITAN
jgi:hypothetical protein